MVSNIFHRLNQPLVTIEKWGIIVGPYAPPFNFLSEPDMVSALAEIGVILLLFGINLTFPISKPVSLARVSLIVAVIEIGLMMHARTS